MRHIIRRCDPGFYAFSSFFSPLSNSTIVCRNNPSNFAPCAIMEDFRSPPPDDDSADDLCFFPQLFLFDFFFLSLASKDGKCFHHFFCPPLFFCVIETCLEVRSFRRSIRTERRTPSKQEQQKRIFHNIRTMAFGKIAILSQKCHNSDGYGSFFSAAMGEISMCIRS